MNRFKMDHEFDIKPYVGVGPIRLGMSRLQVEKILGKAESVELDSASKETTEYREENGLQMVYSETEDKLIEISFYHNVKNVTYMNVDIYKEQGPNVIKLLAQEDGNPFEDVGIIVFFNLGISMTGFMDDDIPEQKSLSVFAKGRWDSMKEELKPFKLK